MSRHSKVIAQMDRQTHRDRQHENITFPHTRAVKIQSLLVILEIDKILKCKLI